MIIIDLKRKVNSDSGLAGETHSFFALSIYFMVFAFFPEQMSRIFGIDSFLAFFSSIVIVSGASLLPDLDNTQSKAMNSLGVVGQGLSSLMRSLAVGIYHLVRTKKDDSEPNPHRGFWHTIASSLLIGAIVYITTGFTHEIRIFDRVFTTGFLFACVYIFICAKLSFSVLFKNVAGKASNGKLATKAGSVIASLLITFVVIVSGESSGTYQWIAFAITFGWLAHLSGDLLTVSGIPALWPIPIRGKMWWDIRILKLKSGSDIEKFFLIPLSIVLIIFSVVKIGAEVL